MATPRVNNGSPAGSASGTGRVTATMTGAGKNAGSPELSDEWGSEFVTWYNQARERLARAGLADQMPNLSDFVYNPNLWQQLMTAFGDDSAKSNFYNQSRAAVREDVNNLLATLENRKYNSPEAQSARLAEAGINPSLTGDSVDNGNTDIPEDATPDTIPETGPISPGDALSVAGSLFTFASSAMGIVQKGIEIGQGIESLAHTKSMNNISELQELFGSIPNMTAFLTGLTPSEDYVDPVTGAEIKAGTPLPASSVGAYIDSFGLRPSAAKLGKQLAGAVRYDKNGNPTTGYQAALNELRAESLENAKKIVKGMSEPGYVDNVKAWAANYNRMYGELIQETTKADLECQLAIARYDAKMHSSELSESDLATRLAGNDAAQALAEFNEEYYNKLSPDAAASAQNNVERQRFVESQQMKYLARIENAYLKHYDRAIQDVYDRNLPKDQEDQLLAGIYSERNEFLGQLAAEKHKMITLAGKSIGDVDLLDAGADALGDALGLVGSLSRGKSKSASKRYTH